MTVEDDVRSLSARVAKLTTAVEKSCTAQVDSAGLCSQTQSDVATLMADVRSMSRRMDALAKAVVKLTGLLDGREELRTTAAYPVAAGAYDEDIARMTNEGATVDEIARWIGCAPSTVGRRRRVLGADGMASKTRWTEAEDARLSSLARRSRDWEEVAADMPGRTASACRQRARHLGVSAFSTSRRWTAGEDEALRSGWADGSADVRDLSRALGRTEAAIRNRAKRLGLSGLGRKRVVARRLTRAF